MAFLLLGTLKMAKDDEIVKLIIDAENLTTDELTEAAGDVAKLGVDAAKTSRELDKLKIQSDTLTSYDNLSKRVEDLQNEIASSVVEFNKLSKEIKNNKDATDEQRLAAAKQSEVTKSLRKELRSTLTEQTKLSKKLRESSIDTKNVADEQVRLADAITSAERKLEDQTKSLKIHTEELKDSVDIQQKSIKAAAEEAIALEKAAVARRKEADAVAASLSAKRRETEENGKTIISLSKYEQALERLNKERNDGLISAGAYIRKEEQLRNQYQLTEKQVATSRRAIEADAKAKEAATRSTDALTTVTRRLAQAYTVLIAAQSATTILRESVTQYGELEAAITKVEKTTGNARKEVEVIADQLAYMAQNITPTATTELLRYAEVAGQLGTKSASDILNLVSAADALNVSTNLAGDEASLLLARILGMTGQGIPAIHNLSSTVVELGNNMKVAEDEIVNMTREIVTGTREIGLSAQASAALGATLAETGQQAERSRTAFFKLSDTIRRSINEGGDSVQKLSEITKQSVDELQANLTDRGEKIILDFVKGLARVREEGGNMSDVLKSFGIEGTEAGAVFSSLTDNVGVLEQAFIRADNAFLDGTKHLEEAAKAYADQESALGRLSNKFLALKKSIGEALADDVDEAIRDTTTLLDRMKEPVIEMVELMPEMVRGFVEIGESVNTLFGTITNNVGVLETGFNRVKFAANGLNSLIGFVTLSVQTATLNLMEMYNAVNLFGGTDLPTEKFKELEAQILKTKESIQRDLDDMGNAAKRMNGESSKAYEDLVNSATKYKDAVNKLNAEQRAQIDGIINSKGFQQGQDELYRELTRTITRQNRELEINNDMKQNANSQASQARIEAYNAAVAKSTQEASAAIGGANKAIGENIELTEAQKIAIREQMELKKEGLITDEMYRSFVNALTGGLADQVQAFDMVTSAKKVEKAATIDAIAEYTKLHEQYQQGLIDYEQLTEASGHLAEQLGGTADLTVKAAEATRFYSQRQTELNDQIEKATANYAEYERELSRGINGDKEKAQILAKMAVEQEKINRLTDKRNAIAEIEKSTVYELTNLLNGYQQELANLEARYQSGAITAGEYLREKERLNEAIGQLNSLTAVNTVVTEKNTEVSRRNADVKETQAQAITRVATAISLELQAAKYLNAEFDYANKSTEELTLRYNQLGSMIQTNTRVSDLWYKSLANISNQGFLREQRVIDETLALRKWSEQVQSGSLSMERLAAMSRVANSYFSNLSQQQLAPLLAAIDSAKRKFQDLNGTIDSSLNDVEDRLARAEGREQDILKRQFERELRQYQEQLAEAQASGDGDMIRKAREVINKLLKAQQAEMKRFQQEQAYAKQEFDKLSKPSVGEYQQPTTNRQIDVSVTTPKGSATITTADYESARKLTDLLSQLGEINIGGNV